MTSLFFGLVGLNVYAIVLVICRARVFHTRLYRPMLLNIGLSVAPLVVLVVGLIAAAMVPSLNGPNWLFRAVVVLVAVVWLVALPNSSYLITELNMSHRREGEDVPLWYDIVLVITLAMSGVFNTVVSVFMVKLLYASFVHFESTVEAFGRVDVQFLPAVVIVLCAFGMYLGRYIRFNSWDLLHPVSFLRKLRDHVAQPHAVRNAIGFTLTHAVFIGLVYVILAGTITDLALQFSAETEQVA